LFSDKLLSTLAQLFCSRRKGEIHVVFFTK